MCVCVCVCVCVTYVCVVCVHVCVCLSVLWSLGASLNPLTTQLWCQYFIMRVKIRRAQQKTLTTLTRYTTWQSLVFSHRLFYRLWYNLLSVFHHWDNLVLSYSTIPTPLSQLLDPQLTKGNLLTRRIQKTYSRPCWTTFIYS